MCRTLLMAGVLAISIMGGCDRSSSGTPGAEKGEVVAYCSVDTEFAEPILAEFEKRTGIKVHRVFDTEAGKTTGLLNRLIAEKARPRADVWWSSEIFGTIQLAEQGVLAEYRPGTASDIPEQYRDPAGRWTALGLRGRVLAYDPKHAKTEDLPKRWCDLGDGKFRGKICMADPRFGTTRGHMASLLTLWGAQKFREYLEALRENGCKLTDGNSQSVLILTRQSEFYCSATDTDDVIGAQRRGDSVEMVYPDLSPFGSGRQDAPLDLSRKWMINEIQLAQTADVPGTLWIPCTVAMVQNGPQAAAARSLVDYLASAEVEEKLAQSESRNVPVRPALREKLKIFAPAPARIDYAAVARKLDESDQLIRDILLK